MGVRKMNESIEAVKYNETYNCRMHKYTINIPLELFKKLEDKCRNAGFEELAPFVRAIMIKEVDQGVISLKDILGEKQFKRQEYLRKLSSNTGEYQAKDTLLKKINKALAIFSN
jgi:hypothetical protein